MPKSNQSTTGDVAAKVSTPKSKTLKRCQCGATVFQGPYQRGEIVSGVMVARETIFQCVNCHAVKPLTELEDYVIDLS